MAAKLYYNLSTGLEFINKIPGPVNLIRIQSSLLEAKCFDKVISELDYRFLLDIAVGHEVFVLDGSVKVVSRALWQGLPWIKYVLYRMWLKTDTIPIVKDIKVNEFFEEKFRELSKDSRNKVRYVRKFLNTQSIKLHPFPLKCYLDGKGQEIYKENLLQALNQL